MASLLVPVLRGGGWLEGNGLGECSPGWSCDNPADLILQVTAWWIWSSGGSMGPGHLYIIYRGFIIGRDNIWN